MTNFAWLILIILILTFLGSATLILITLKYYWGERGKPPLSGAQRRQQKDEELRLRAKQIELSKKYPRETRRSSFWDNSKVYKK